MKNWIIILIVIILAIIESTLFNFVNFKIPISLCLLLFLINREKNDEAIVLILFGGLMLDLLSSYWFGAHIFYFGATFLILTKAPYDFQAIKNTILGYLVILINIFIFLEVSNLMNYKFVILSSLGTALVMSCLVFILLKTRIFIKYEHI